MKHLCVSLLGDDRQALVELEDSVREFTNRYQTWNASRNQEHIRKLEQDLDQVRREEANIAATLRAIRETETYRHPTMFGSYSGTVQAIAARLRAEVEKFNWVLEYGPSQADPPLSDDEAQQLLALLRNTTTQEDAAQYPINLSSLLSPQDFSLLVQREAEAQARFLSLATYRSHPDYAVLKKLGREQREKTVDLLRSLINACSRLCNLPDPWVKQAAKDVLLQRHRSWQELLRKCK